ncbi:MAG TPA: M23 family metallopeptidase, partial [Proteobacteria bacterium]|nr:M23 family metallopeptidase [Pseudomonadota bacterium]
QIGRAVSTDGPSDAPVSGRIVARGAAGVHPIRISSPFGWRTHPIYGYRHFHTGVDIALPKGYPIRTPEAGVVEFAGPIKGYGNTVIVRIDDGSRLLFAHLDSIETGQGDRIGAGTRIGTAGETGNATGPHLHLELRVDGKPVDPLSVPGLAEAIETVLSQSDKGGG